MRPIPYYDPSKEQSEPGASGLFVDAISRSGQSSKTRSRPDSGSFAKHPINPETMAINRAYWALPEVRVYGCGQLHVVLSQWADGDAAERPRKTMADIFPRHDRRAETPPREI